MKKCPVCNSTKVSNHEGFHCYKCGFTNGKMKRCVVCAGIIAPHRLRTFSHLNVKTCSTKCSNAWASQGSSRRRKMPMEEK